jgi:CBS domain-containing protein
MFDKMKSEQKRSIMAQVDIRAFLRQTKIKDIMTTKIISIRIDAPFSEVPKKMNDHGIRHLPVVDGGNKLMGLMTQRDLYKVHSPRKLEDGNWYYDEEALNAFILKNVMLKEPKTMTPEDCIGEALVAMIWGKFGCIPIIEKDRRLCGILTRADILKLAARIYKPELFK